METLTITSRNSKINLYYKSYQEKKRGRSVSFLYATYHWSWSFRRWHHIYKVRDKKNMAPKHGCS